MRDTTVRLLTTVIGVDAFIFCPRWHALTKLCVSNCENIVTITSLANTTIFDDKFVDLHTFRLMWTRVIEIKRVTFRFVSRNTSKITVGRTFGSKLRCHPTRGPLRRRKRA